MLQLRHVGPGRATGIAKRAFDGCKAKLTDHDTSDSSYHTKRPLSVSLGPRSATATPGQGPRAQSVHPATFKSTVGRTPSRPPPTSAAVAPTTTVTGPCGTTRTSNKVPGVVKVEGFQTLKLSAQPAATAPVVQPVVGSTTTPTVVKQKAMPTTRGGTPRPLAPVADPQRTTCSCTSRNQLMIRRRSNIGVIVRSKLRHD